MQCTMRRQVGRHTRMRASFACRYEFSQGDGTTVWQGPESFNLSVVVSRWSLPMGATDAELGSGISWALHPSVAKYNPPHGASPRLQTQRHLSPLHACDTQFPCTVGTPPFATRSSASSRRRTSRAGSRPTFWTATPSARRWRAPSTRGLPTTRRSTSRT